MLYSYFNSANPRKTRAPFSQSGIIQSHKSLIMSVLRLWLPDNGLVNKTNVTTSTEISSMRLLLVVFRALNVEWNRHTLYSERHVGPRIHFRRPRMWTYVCQFAWVFAFVICQNKIRWGRERLTTGITFGVTKRPSQMHWGGESENLGLLENISGGFSGG